MMIVTSLISVCISWVTFFLVKKSGMSATRISSLVSLCCFLVLHGLSQLYQFDIIYFSSLIFGASFVGMCSHETIKDWGIIIAATLYSIIFVFAQPQSYGVGGALGFSAFTAVFFVWGVSKAFHHYKTLS